MHVAGAASALDVVDLSIAEYGDLRSLLQRKEAAVVFQQDGSLASRAAGERDVFFTGGNTGTVIAKRNAGGESGSGPFFNRKIHNESSFSN